MSYNKIKVIVFDFDGTLVDSNQLKKDAFYSLFIKSENSNKIVSNILSKYIDTSRFEIIERVLIELNNSSIIKEEVNKLASNYNSIVINGILNSKGLKESEYILKKLYMDYSLYLSSNTPVESLVETVKRLNWSNYFKDMFGLPSHKKNTLDLIIQKNKYLKEEILVIGDGISDQESAEYAGVNYYEITPQRDNLLKIMELLNV